MRTLITLTNSFLLGLCSLSCNLSADVARSDSDPGGGGGAEAVAGAQNLAGQVTAQGGAEPTAGAQNLAGQVTAQGGAEPTAGAQNLAGQVTAQGGAEPTAGANSAGGVAPVAGASGEGGVEVSGGAGGAAGDSLDPLVGEDRSDEPPSTDPEISEQDFAAYVAAANQFGLELAQQASSTGQLDPEQNGVFSPASALFALGMTYAGARGDTATAMKNALHDELPEGVFHVAQNRMMRELASRNMEGVDSVTGDPKRIQVTPTNSLWADRTLTVQPDFLDLLSREYDSGMVRVDFVNQTEPARLAINSWVEERTQNRIVDLLQPGDVDRSTRLVLVNALYLYASWATVFDSEKTFSADFTTLSDGVVRVEMMYSPMTPSWPCKMTESFALAQIPYYQESLQLTVVLPAPGQFEAVRDEVSADWLADAMRDLTPTSLNLGMPKFVIETGQLKLTQALVNLGMEPIFSGDADFTGLSAEQPLFVSDVVQKAYIGTDEAGTEAAAATAVILAGGVIDPTTFVLDRPFLFFITDLTGLVLFSGQVVNPSAS